MARRIRAVKTGKREGSKELYKWGDLVEGKQVEEEQEDVE
jgi:hypothetical protein